MGLYPGWKGGLNSKSSLEKPSDKSQSTCIMQKLFHCVWIFSQPRGGTIGSDVILCQNESVFIQCPWVLH